MFGKLNLLLSLCVFAAGCAEPKYVQKVDSSTPPTNSSQKVNECSITFAKSGLCLEWTWEVKPNSKDYGSLVFKVFRLNAYDQSQVLVDLNTLPNLVLWMPSMGHGSVPTKMERLDTGTYRAYDVYFIMPGDWDLMFQTQDGNGTTDEATVSIIF